MSEVFARLTRIREELVELDGLVRALHGNKAHERLITDLLETITQLEVELRRAMEERK
jgi:hypothetical protein